MSRQELLQSIAATIKDYRTGEIPRPTPDHVERWIRQFDAAVQEPMLAEMDHLLKQSYLSRDYCLSFLRGLAGRSRLTGGVALWQMLRTALARLVGFATRGQKGCPAHWRHVRLLEIQKHGASQHEMVRLLKDVLIRGYGLNLDLCKPGDGPFLYLDDVLFTGNRVIADIAEWIRTDAPPRARLVVIVIGMYRNGFWYTHRRILQAAAEARKTIRVDWLRAVEFEDRRWARPRDAFQPTVVPSGPSAHAYERELGEAGAPPRLRVPDPMRPSRLFSSEAGRHLLEQQLLLAGLKIRSFYRNPREVLRPLGYDWQKGLGFGATVVTYRNCPNNCPLAWWWDGAALPFSRPDDPWYPLLPRKV